jgi:hypothetical protein
MEPEGSLTHLQLTDTRPYPEPDRSSSCIDLLRNAVHKIRNGVYGGLWKW